MSSASSTNTMAGRRSDASLRSSATDGADGDGRPRKPAPGALPRSITIHRRMPDGQTGDGAGKKGVRLRCSVLTMELSRAAAVITAVVAAAPRHPVGLYGGAGAVVDAQRAYLRPCCVYYEDDLLLMISPLINKAKNFPQVALLKNAEIKHHVSSITCNYCRCARNRRLARYDIAQRHNNKRLWISRGLPMEELDFLTLDDLGKLIHLSRSRLYGLIREAGPAAGFVELGGGVRIPLARAGRRWLCRKRDVEAALFPEPAVNAVATDSAASAPRRPGRPRMGAK